MATIHQYKPDHNGPFVIYWVRSDRDGNVRRSFYTGTSGGCYEFNESSDNAVTYSTYEGARRQKKAMHRKCGPKFQGTLWVASE